MSVEWPFLIALNEQLRLLKDPVEVQEVAVRLIGEHLQASRVHYAHIEGDEFVIRRTYVDGVPPFPGRGPLAWVGRAVVDACRRGETVIVDDVNVDPRFTGAEREQLLAGRIEAFVGAPLIKGGRWLGTFAVHSATPRKWTRDQVALVEITADRTWSAVERARAEEALDQELRANQDRLAFLLRLSDAVRPLSDAAAIQETAARQLCEYLGAARAGYVEPGAGQFIIRREHARTGEPLVGMPLRIAVSGALGEALQRGETIVVNDTQADPRLSVDDRATFQSQQIAAFVGVARFKDGRMAAAFGVNHDTPRAWTHGEVELVREVAERTWDAVERCRAEAALRDQNTRLQLALEASAGGSWTWTPETNEVDWDDVFRAQFGFTPEDRPAYELWLSRVHAEDSPRLLRSLEEVMRTGHRWDNTYRVVRPDGSVRWIQSLGRADRDAAGRVTRLTGLELDVTERRTSEDARQTRRDEEHDRTLRTLLETATQGIVSTDADGVIIFANRAVEVMFGWMPGELIGRPVERLIPAVGRDGASLAGGLDLVGIREDGSTFPIDVTINKVPAAGGDLIFSFVTDITERQRVAQALRERTAELEYRTTQLSRMAWDLTLAEHHAREQIARALHDGLQQLLVIVSLNLEQHLKHETEGGVAPSELLTEAKQTVDEASAVARSLNVELFPPVLHRSGLPAALTWLATWMEEKYKLSVEVTADPGADTPRRDVRTLLFESARELLFNAVKYAKADRVTLSLALDPDSQLSVTVTDDGAGFDPARLDDRSKTGQVGWGLFRMRERLTLLGGRLDLDSAPGRGTRVRIVAPRDAAPDMFADTNELNLPLMSPASTIEDVHASPDALRILIADDHPAVRHALRELLHQREEFSVVGDAANGFEAIAQAHALRPDVILMDVAMPHMDGVEATARIRVELPHIVVFGLSMMSRNEIADAVERAGAAGFYVKGTDTPRLIDHLLNVHAARGAGARAPW